MLLPRLALLLENGLFSFTFFALYLCVEHGEAQSARGGGGGKKGSSSQQQRKRNAAEGGAQSGSYNQASLSTESRLADRGEGGWDEKPSKKQVESSGS